LLRREAVEKLTDGDADGVGGSRGSFTQQMLELGEHLLDGVQVWGVFRQEEEFGTGGPYGSANSLSLMTAEIVHDDNVAGSQGRDEKLLDIDLKRLAVDRTVEEPWGIDAIMTERGEEGHGLPATVGDLGPEPRAARRPSPERRHVGLGPSLIEEDQAAGFNPVLIGQPPRAPSRDVGAILFAGEHGFF